MIYRQSLGTAYAASSGSCLDALASASGEGGVKKSDERHVRSIREYCATYVYDNDIFVIACLTIGRAYDSFSCDCNIVRRPQSLHILMNIRDKPMPQEYTCLIFCEGQIEPY